jgi:hypothetical protein
MKKAKTVLFDETVEYFTQKISKRGLPVLTRLSEILMFVAVATSLNLKCLGMMHPTLTSTPTPSVYVRLNFGHKKKLASKTCRMIDPASP